MIIWKNIFLTKEVKHKTSVPLLQICVPDAHLELSPALRIRHLSCNFFNSLSYSRVFDGCFLFIADLVRVDLFLCIRQKNMDIASNCNITHLRQEKYNTHQISEAVFPAFHVGKHIMLQAGHGTEFALVVWGDRFIGAAVLPHILKTCRHVKSIGYPFQYRKRRRLNRFMGRK